jgi:ectoine hydroxylase-related dioxygenase (phytanoyl-CoA dioxygenase family)
MSTATALPQLHSYGHALDMDDAKAGWLRESADAAGDMPELRRRLAEEGYLYLRGYLDRDEVLAARASLTDRLAQAGVLDPAHPPIDGVCRPGAGYVFRPEIANGNPAVQNLLYTGRLVAFYEQLFGEAIRHYDFTWLRAIGPGKGTNPHCDLPYMGRGTHRHLTCWLPYGDIAFELGGLMILEGSHRRMDLLESYVYRDVDGYCENRPRDASNAKAGKWTFSGTLSHHPPMVRDKFGGRWLTTEFRAGDILTFGMFVVHASLDNRTANRLRISSDSRYQRASEAIDDRWIGPNPPGHSTAGKRGRIC